LGICLAFFFLATLHFLSPFGKRLCLFFFFMVDDFQDREDGASWKTLDFFLQPPFSLIGFLPLFFFFPPVAKFSWPSSGRPHRFISSGRPPSSLCCFPFVGIVQTDDASFSFFFFFKGNGVVLFFFLNCSPPDFPQRHFLAFSPFFSCCLSVLALKASLFHFFPPFFCVKAE